MTITVIICLSLGALLGVTLGIPLGRRVERAAWYTDAALSRARIAAQLIRDLAGWAGAALLVLTLTALALIWAIPHTR